jgi:hypothetical protein
MEKPTEPSHIVALTAAAVSHFWQTRRAQQQKQVDSGLLDAGLRSAVTGGAQMNAFVDLFAQVIVEAGLHSKHIYYNTFLELPGFFRPTKEWDLLVVKDGQLLAAIEAKSQVGPSFGNNFNNRTEEAMGSALDVWTAYREGAFHTSISPFLGYFFMLEDCEKARAVVRVKEPHFPVLPEFKGTSYAQRYELFCRKLVRERHYTASALLMSDSVKGETGEFSEPAPDLSISLFVRALAAHVSAYA